MMWPVSLIAFWDCLQTSRIDYLIFSQAYSI
uniref:Uncharacterized protein n=1 Tax=Arundo donax TaxID=35708 RepID=A0A0A9GCC2_ARUDO